MGVALLYAPVSWLDLKVIEPGEQGEEEEEGKEERLFPKPAPPVVPEPCFA